MDYFIYDGSFQGLLTAIYEAFYSKNQVGGILREDEYQPAFFANKIPVEADLQKSDQLYLAIKNKISPQSLRKIYYVFLSEKKETGLLIYHYLRLGFKIGRKIDSYLNHELVARLNQLSGKVSREAHLLKGLLRFRKIEGGGFYAPFEPDYNIITLLAAHFARRLADQDWLIHDKRRGLAAVYNREEWLLTDMVNLPDLRLTEEEKHYQRLWQSFYQHIAIEARKNPRLQVQNMPRRYWKYLIEK